MASRTSLQSFLATARAALAANAPKQASPLTFVIGNESADLDSLCSAIVFAYLRTHTAPHTLHIPLSNLPREDLSLRPEMTHVLKHAGLKPSDILTLTELPELDAQDTRWLLVDHNAPTGFLKEKYSEQVIGCIDHHADEAFIPEDAGTRTIEPCGSCMSLIVEDARGVWKELSNQEADVDIKTEDEKLAKLALAPILIDTANLKSEDKVRPKDNQAAEFLESLLQYKTFNRTRFFDDVSDVKADISSLSLRDVFRKDYKEWEDNGLKLGISSVVQNLDFLMAKLGNGQDGMLNKLKEWSEERKLDISSIMTTSHDDQGSFQRELLVWGVTERGGKVLNRFEEDTTGKLQLKTWQRGSLDSENRRVWVQSNLSASRKQVAPLAREAMKNI